MALPVAVLLPTLWDRRQLEACRARWSDDVEVRFIGPDDDDVDETFDAAAFLRHVAEAHPDLRGVLSSSDYPGAVVAAMAARRLGLAGSDPSAVLAAGHKGEARASHGRAVPEAVPWWRLLQAGGGRGAPEGLRYPCFLKPARGAFSRLAREVRDAATLGALLADARLQAHSDDYVALHRDLARLLGHVGPDPGLFLVEELLQGRQVTIEGWVESHDVHLLGCVDSVMYPGTRAFQRFETPSRLPQDVQERLGTLTRRIVAASGLTWTGFNAEWIWEEATGRLTLVELNPRLAGQFADLWQKTLGLGGYEVALALALGRSPPPAPGGAFPFAASVPLRTFAPVRVERAPDAACRACVEAAHSGALIWWECRTDDVLADFDRLGEGQGYRYGVVNLGAWRREDLVREAERIVAALGAVLTPLPSTPLPSTPLLPTPLR